MKRLRTKELVGRKMFRKMSDINDREQVAKSSSCIWRARRNCKQPSTTYFINFIKPYIDVRYGEDSLVKLISLYEGSVRA